MSSEVYKHASISECGLYRYSLTRVWNPSLPVLVFCMLNPSTADADNDDPTIRRCIGFAKRESCGGIDVVNLFAFRATDPSTLPERDSDKTGPLNLIHVSGVALGRRVIAAWGAHPSANPTAVGQLLNALRGNAISIECLGTTKSGAPRHPLYVRADAPLVPFTQQQSGGAQ